MPSIKCTAKLAKRAGTKVQNAVDQSPGDWHANVFTFDRQFYVIFVQDKSRITCLAGPVKKVDLQDIGELLRSSLQNVLDYEGFSQPAIVYAVGEIKDMNLCKTDNRSILGTINDNIFHIDYHLWRAGGIELTTLSELVAHVNHMPIRALDWAYAIDVYRRNLIHVVT
jgi:hypothetical protein